MDDKERLNFRMAVILIWHLSGGNVRIQTLSQITVGLNWNEIFTGIRCLLLFNRE